MKSGPLGTRPLARLAALLALVALQGLLSSAAEAASPPSASFTAPSGQVLPGTEVTFTSTSTDPDPADATLAHAWDLDGDDAFDDGTGTSVSRTYAASATYTVKLRVTDTDPGVSDTATRTVVVNAPPVASFSVSPAGSVLTGETVTFTSTSHDPDGAVVAHAWELDGDDDFNDDPDATASRQFAGDTTVKLRVTDDDGAQAVAQALVNVVDGIPPTASFNFFPGQPLAGDLVTFTSTSSDPDGPLSTAWDLDGDGAFGEGGEVGLSVARAFPSAGSYPIALQVTDQDGFVRTASATVPVAPPPAGQAPAGATPGSAARLMSPFPVVRVRGRFTRRGTRITLISMTVPKGARVTLTCRGRSCRVKRKRKTARSTRVRFTELSGTLRPGTLIRIYVEQRGRIGKYARFKIRRGRPPLRSDACLGPGSTRPRPCPD